MDINQENKSIKYLNFGTGLNIPFLPWNEEQLKYAEEALEEAAKNSCCCSCYCCEGLYELERIIDKVKAIKPDN